MMPCFALNLAKASPLARVQVPGMLWGELEGMHFSGDLVQGIFLVERKGGREASSACFPPKPLTPIFQVESRLTRKRIGCEIRIQVALFQW